jgi:hypothetical protein
MYQGGNGPVRCTANKSDEVECLVSGIVCSFADLDDDLAPAGDGFDFRQWLEIERANKVKQRPVFSADAGEFHTPVTQTAQEQRTRCIQTVEPGNIKRARGSWLRPLRQGCSCNSERDYFKNTRQRKAITIAADDNRWRNRFRGSPLLVCTHTGHGLSKAPRHQNELNESDSIFFHVGAGASIAS